MKEYDFFPSPIITPSTKAEEGHDEDIDENSILEQGIVSPQEWRILKEYSLSLFERGKQIAAERGLILADTKYEFGKIGDEIYLMDEVHTPDSSRYFYASNFLEIIKKGERPAQLSKEFVREWLIENNFMGKPGQEIPIMSESWINTISDRYIKLYEEVTGLQFQPFEPNESDWEIVKQSL
jgi:phosphoribosylaminoimidazole-succinocarboxamide synthase